MSKLSDKFEEFAFEVSKATGVQFKVAMLLLFGIYSVLFLGLPPVVEFFGASSAAVGIATQILCFNLARKYQGPSIIKDLNKNLGFGFALLAISFMTLFFALFQTLTLTGIVPKGILIQW